MICQHRPARVLFDRSNLPFILKDALASHAPSHPFMALNLRSTLTNLTAA